MKMAKFPKVLFPEPIATKAFTDASKAVARLEEIVANNAQEAGAKSQAAADELGVLKADNAELRKLTDTVSARLDATIGELKTILER